jgi:hypothetical protein
MARNSPVFFKKNLDIVLLNVLIPILDRMRCILGSPGKRVVEYVRVIMTRNKHSIGLVVVYALRGGWLQCCAVGVHRRGEFLDKLKFPLHTMFKLLLCKVLVQQP